MPDYRWNVSDFAAGYDAAAEHIHPYYLDLQQRVLDLLPYDRDAALFWVDAGGGSGRLAEQFLRRFPRARAAIVDQSEPFLALAERRLSAFPSRVDFVLARLQNEWCLQLSEHPHAIVSMSAIHHLDSREKQQLYQQCFAALRPGGLFINADEVRPQDDADYLDRCRSWAGHMRQMMAQGKVPPSMHAALQQWETRNVAGFGSPRSSGDDCHETIDVQRGYLTAAGFRQVECPWQKEMWAVLVGTK